MSLAANDHQSNDSARCSVPSWAEAGSCCFVLIAVLCYFSGEDYLS